MVWYSWLFLIGVLAVPGVICGILYSGKNDSTPCIGCGECIRTGECAAATMQNTAKAAKKAAEKRKKEREAS